MNVSVPNLSESRAAKLLDGKVMSDRVVQWVKATTRDLAPTGIVPGIAVVIVGDDPASRVYVSSKGRTARECGFRSFEHALPERTTQAELLELVESLNADPTVNGILVQLPLPKHVDPVSVIQAIDPDKDVDGFHALNVGRLGTGDLGTAFVPCTPAGCLILIESVHGPDLSGLHAVVIGRSNIVGKPMASLLLAANATITVAHKATRDLPTLCRSADILVAAVGRPLMVKKEWVKPGATVVDVGINRVPAPERGEGKSKLVGDVDFEGVATVAGAITPVPGGVGPMTISLLMANTLASAARAGGRPVPRFSARV